MLQEDIETRDKFLYTLNWLAALLQRHPGCLRFGLIHIEFETPHRLGETFGAKIATNLLASFADSLRQAFRSTDLVARDGSSVWVLTPLTEPDNVTSKVADILVISSADGLDLVERNIRVFSLPEQLDVMQIQGSAGNLFEHIKASGQGKTVAQFASIP